MEKLDVQVKALLKRRLVQVLLVIVLLLWALPEALRIGLQVYSPKAGYGELAIKDIDLNLFSGRLAVEQLHLQREGQDKLRLRYLELNLGWLGLLEREWRVESIKLDGVVLPVIQLEKGWEVVIPLLPEAPVAEETSTDTELPRFNLQSITLADSQLNLHLDGLDGDVNIGQVALDNISSWRSDAADFLVEAQWNGAPVSLSLQAKTLLKTPDVSGQLSFKGLQLGSFARLLPAEISGLAGQLSTQLRFSFAQQETDNYRWQLAGQADVAELAAQYQQLVLSNQVLNWQGELKGGLAAGVVSFQLVNQLQAQVLELVDLQREVTLLSWQGFEIADLQFDQQQKLNLQELRIEQPVLLQHGEDKPLMAMSALSLDSLSQSAEGVHAGVLQFHDGQYQLVLTPEGKLQLQEELAASLRGLASDEPASQAEEVGMESGEPVAFRLDKLVLQGDSDLYFRDQRFEVPVQQHLKLKQFELGPVDQGRPELPLTLQAQGSLGEFSSLAVDGTAKPFLTNPEVAMKGKLENIDLPSVSPYTESVLGYELQTGQYDHQFDLDIRNDRIKLNNDLSLRQLAVAPVQDDKPRPLDQQLDVPLGLALDMLRDGDDNIHLKIPLEGALDDLSVDVNDVIGKAVGKALKTGAVGYLKYAIQPFGAILMVGEMVAGELGSMQLDPLLYTAGAATPVTEQAGYVEKLADLLNQRPGLELKICGESSLADREAIQASLLAEQQALAAANKEPKALQPTETVEKPEVSEAQLLKLATERASRVKREFIAAGIDGKRLYLCKPGYRGDGISGVRLMM